MSGGDLSNTIDVDARVEPLDSEVEAGLPEDYYTLPDELIRQSYDPIETRFQHPVIPLHARVILASDSARDTYGTVFQLVAKSLPIRAARLLDLSQRLERARERFLARQNWEELYRLRLNEHANWVNDRVRQDLERLRKEHEERRTTLAIELQRLEAELAEKEAPHRERIAQLERELAQARLQHAEARHAAIAQAEQALEQAEAAAIARHQPAIDAARERRDQVRLEIAQRLAEEAAAVREEARTLASELVEAVHREEAILAEAHYAAARAKEQQVAALDDSRKAEGEATAGVGLLPEEARTDPRNRLLTHVNGDAVLANEEAQYPLPDQGWWGKLFTPVAQFLATLACGSIFGLSLALLTQFVRSLPQLSTQPQRGVMAAFLGMFVFWIIGKVVHRSTTLAAETALENPKQGLATLSLAVVTILAIAAMEMCVERYGIVEAARKASLEYSMGGEGQAGSLDGLAGWCIAAVVALPFILYHAFGGWMEVRYRMAERCRKSRIAQARQSRVEGPLFQAFVAAVHRRENEEQRLRNAPGLEFHPDVVKAAKQLEFASRRREQHPVLCRAEQLDAEMRQRLDTDPLVQYTEAKLRTAENALASDPELQAARRRLEREMTAPDTTPAIVELEHLLRKARDQWQQDPAVVAASSRVNQTQTTLSRLDESYTAERVRIEKQRKPIRHVPDKHMRARIQDAREEWQAAQLLFDAELALVLRLLECPRYLRWWEHLRLYLSQEGFSRLSVPAPSESVAYESSARRSGWLMRVARATLGVAATSAGSVLILQLLRR